MKVVAILHGKKIEGLNTQPAELRSNPNLSIDGLVGVQGLVEQVRAKGPFVAMYSSRLARALDTASILALGLDMDFQTIKNLGQHCNRDADGDSFYPGFEGETVIEWRDQAIAALQEIERNHDYWDTILVISHRPSVGGLIAHAKGITDLDAIMKIVLGKFGPIVEFEFDEDGTITLTE